MRFIEDSIIINDYFEDSTSDCEKSEFKYCPYCGEKVEKDWKYCAYCGKLLKICNRNITIH